jgi:hypothetical protein
VFIAHPGRSSYPFFPLFLGEDDGTEGGGSEKEPDSKESKKDFKLEELPEDQQKFIRGLIKQARDDGKKTADTAIEAARKAAQEEADRKKLEAEGNYEEASKKLLSRAEEAEQKLTDAETKNARYADLVKSQIDRLKAEVPEEALKGFNPEADPLDQITFLQDRKEIVDALLPASKRKKEGEEGAEGDPAKKLPNAGEGDTKPSKEQSDEERKKWEDARRAQMAREF